MTLPIVICRNQLGRTPTRGKSYARPLSSGMEISNFTRRAGNRFSPNRCDLGAVIFSRVTEPGGWQTTTGHRVPLQFLWALSVPRTVFSGLARFKPLQKSQRCVADRFQSSHSFLTVCETQLQSHTGASACPTQDGSHPTQNRVST